MIKDTRGGKRADSNTSPTETGDDFHSMYERMGDYAKSDDRFFGRTYRVSNKYFHYEHFRDNDSIIINTSNIKFIKGEPVLIIGNNEAVYVKEWNVRPVHNYDTGFNGYAVRLQRRYFKPYTFRRGFDDFYFERPDTFDSLVQVAKEQDRRNMKIAMRHMN